MRCKQLIAALFLLGMLWGGPATAQIIFGQPASGDIGFVFSSFSLESDSVKNDLAQFAIPLRGFIPLGDNLEAVVYVDNSSNTIETGEVDSKLSGLGDLRLQVSRSFSEDQFVVGLGISLPTGKKKLTDGEETDVLSMLALDYLDLPMRRFGQGMGFSLTVGTARMLGEWRFGAGAGYQMNGKYDPYENITDYDPGDVINFNAGADRSFGQVLVSTDIVISAYGSDKLEGTEVFKQSTQVSTSLDMFYDAAGYSLSGGIGYTIRGRNNLYTGTDSELKIYGNQFLIAASGAIKLSDKAELGPSVVFRNIAANENDFGSSTIIGLGLSGNASLSEQFAFNAGLTYYTGSADGGNVDLSGLSIAFGLTASL